MIRYIFSTLFIFSVTTATAQTRLPQLALRSTDGDVLKIADFVSLKKPLVISFLATYCTPCLMEFEAVADLYDDWKKEVDFEFIAISIDDSRSSGKVKSLISGKNWPFIVLIDENQEVRRAMNITDIPFYYIFDRKGNYVYKHAGYLPGDEFIMLRELKKAVNE